MKHPTRYCKEIFYVGPKMSLTKQHSNSQILDYRNKERMEVSGPGPWALPSCFCVMLFSSSSLSVSCVMFSSSSSCFLPSSYALSHVIVRFHSGVEYVHMRGMCFVSLSLSDACRSFCIYGWVLLCERGEYSSDRET